MGDAGSAIAWRTVASLGGRLEAVSRRARVGVWNYGTDDNVTGILVQRSAPRIWCRVGHPACGQRYFHWLAVVRCATAYDQTPAAVEQYAAVA